MMGIGGLPLGYCHKPIGDHAAHVYVYMGAEHWCRGEKDGKPLPDERRTGIGSPPYFSQDSNAHVLGPAAKRQKLLDRLIARCASGYFRDLASSDAWTRTGGSGQDSEIAKS